MWSLGLSMKHQKVVLCFDFTFYLFAFFILPLGNEFFIPSHVVNKIFWKLQGHLWEKPNDNYDPSLGFQCMGSSIGTKICNKISIEFVLN